MVLRPFRFKVFYLVLYMFKLINVKERTISTVTYSASPEIIGVKVYNRQTDRQIL